MIFIQGENVIIDPNDDGVKHINIYSKGKTALGRMLSNFYRANIDTPDGKFLSVEGYWYWLSIEDCPEKEALRNTYGIYAKMLGKKILETKNKRFEPDFENKIMKAIWSKVKQKENLALFIPKYRDLPFEHYYNYGGKIVNVKEKYRWLIDRITDMRDYIYRTYY